jgi:hypothetical protein
MGRKLSRKNGSEEIGNNYTSPLTKPPTSPRNQIHCSLILGPNLRCACYSPVPSSNIKIVFPYEVLLIKQLRAIPPSTHFSNSVILLFSTTGSVGSVMPPLRALAARFPCVTSASRHCPVSWSSWARTVENYRPSLGPVMWILQRPIMLRLRNSTYICCYVGLAKGVMVGGEVVLGGGGEGGH